MNLSAPIEKLARVGPQYQKKLKRLGIKTVGQLLFHFPHRYEDFSDIIAISEIKSGKTASIRGKILEIKNLRTFRKRLTLTQALVGDDSGTIRVVWFNQPYLINTLKNGDFIFLAGKLNQKGEGRYLSSPVYEKITPEQKIQLAKKEANFALTHTGRLVPVYPGTEGLSSRWLRFIIKPLLFNLKNKIPDSLPRKIIEKHKLLPFQKAIWQIHFPDSIKLAEKARERFSFEELFNLALFILKEKMELAKEKARVIPLDIELIKNFTNNLPFRLTDDQRKAAWQILKDLEKSRPMNRLLEGDVGSGKTIVAAIASLNAIKAGFQVVIMAPTEILAKQHFKTFLELFKKYKLNVGLITGREVKLKNKKISRKKVLEKAEKGEVDIIIGTHALISSPTKNNFGKQDKIKFANLALVIIDEQHRFGVEQRARLCRNKNRRTKTIPHFLSMTATPIPRTLSLTIYGDLDLSLIKELPRGRKKIITKIVYPKERKTTYNFIRKQAKKGRQTFVICPRIEPSDKKNAKNGLWAEVKAVKEEHEKLSKEIFPDLKVAMLHGKMKNEEKEKIMKCFKGRKTDILVSTSVVEVGVDIPNATIMVIEGADKFGLAQLHQFRGRVGRRKEQSFCFLFTEYPAGKTQQRLRALINCESGFELAEKDLKIRGPGDFLGQKQWGIPDLTMNSLRNVSLVEKTREAAKEILNEDAELKKYPLLREKLEEFQKKTHFE